MLLDKYEMEVSLRKWFERQREGGRDGGKERERERARVME